MDKYNIVLNVWGSHVEGDQENTLELYTEGMLTHDDNKYIIEYDESVMSGIKNTITRLTIDGDKVWLARSGLMDTEFFFGAQQMYEATYETPFGIMQMSVLPTQILSDVSTESGNINLEYVIQVGEQSALNRLNINYKLKN